MAPNAIVMKLNDLLAGPVDNECKVVYLLTEVRKLVEHTYGKRGRPFALNLYCAWALHVDLHGLDTVGPFFQQVDAYVDGVLVGPEDLGASDRMVREFLTFDTLRAQMRDFFQANGIRTELTDEDARWNEFVKHYAGVIEDGSLSIHAPNHGMKHVKAVTFTKGREAMGEFKQLPFEMTWRIELLQQFKGFRSLDIDVSARPPKGEVGQMIGTSISLNA